MLLGCTSCAFIKGLFVTDADSLFNTISKTMEKVESYEIITDMSLSTKVNGVKVTASSTGKTIQTLTDGKEYYYYSEATSTVSAPTIDKTATVTLISAYHNGNAFMSSAQFDTHLYSEMSEKEFKSYISNGALADETFQNCTKKTYGKTDDGFWTLTYSGYSNETINQMLELFGSAEGMWDEIDVTDIKWTIVADEEFRMTKCTAGIIFDVDPSAGFTPHCLMSFTCDNYTDVKPITDTISTDDYQKVEDIRILDKYEDMLEALAEKENGEVELEVKQIFKSSAGVSTFHETDTITYGVKNGKYFYDIFAVISGHQSVTIKYANGKNKTTSGGQTQSVDMTDAEAKRVMDNLLNSAKFNKYRVAQIEVNRDETLYTFKAFAPDPAVYESALASLGTTTVKSAEQTITIKVRGGEIAKIESTELIKGNYISGGANRWFELSFETTLTVK